MAHPDFFDSLREELRQETANWTQGSVRRQYPSAGLLLQEEQAILNEHGYKEQSREQGDYLLTVTYSRAKPGGTAETVGKLIGGVIVVVFAGWLFFLVPRGNDSGSRSPGELVDSAPRSLSRAECRRLEEQMEGAINVVVALDMVIQDSKSKGVRVSEDDIEARSRARRLASEAEDARDEGGCS